MLENIYKGHFFVSPSPELLLDAKTLDHLMCVYARACVSVIAVFSFFL